MNKKRSHSIDVVFVLVLFCTFAVAVLMVLMIGASSYNDVADSMTENYENRTGVAYIAEKVRHFGENDSVSIGEFDGLDALILSQDIEGEKYATYIYYYDGSIRELFTKAGNDLPPEAGQQIVEASGFSAKLIGGNLLKVTCESNDGTKPYILLDVNRKGASAGALAAVAEPDQSAASEPDQSAENQPAEDQSAEEGGSHE